MRKALFWVSAASVAAALAWLVASDRRAKRPRAAESPPGETPETVYHCNPGSRVFHAPSCKYYDCKGCVESYASREEAVAAGFKPCTLCLP